MRGQRSEPISSGPAGTPAASARDVRPHPAVARIVASQGNVTSMGSGTLVHVTAKYGIVITNWHVVRDARESVEVIFPDGFRSRGTVMKLDKDWDLAAIGIWRPAASPVSISTIPPKRGDPLTIAGYGSGDYRSAAGRCTQYVAPGKKHPFEMIELSAEARQGDSGGPIFNARGELAGVLLGAKKGHTVGSFCGRVGHFLVDVNRTLDQHQPERLAAAGGKRRGRLVPVRGDTLEPAVAAIGGGRPLSGSSPRPTAMSHFSESPASGTPPRTLHGSLGSLTRQLCDFLGTTPAEQAKTFLATIGALSLLICGMRFFKIDG